MLSNLRVTPRGVDEYGFADADARDDDGFERSRNGRSAYVETRRRRADLTGDIGLRPNGPQAAGAFGRRVRSFQKISLPNGRRMVPSTEAK